MMLYYFTKTEKDDIEKSWIYSIIFLIDSWVVFSFIYEPYGLMVPYPLNISTFFQIDTNPFEKTNGIENTRG